MPHIFRYNLSLPPSINEGYELNTRTKRHIYTKKVYDWKDNAAKELMVARVQQKFKTLTVPAHCNLYFHFSNKKCDLNNYLKFLYDSLEVGGIIEDDTLIYSEFHHKFIVEKGDENVEISVCDYEDMESMYEDEKEETGESQLNFILK